MHDRYGDTGQHQLVQGIDGFPGERILAVVEAIVTRPRFKQIAKDE